MYSMHKACEKCNYIYEREPGYFYGAMYVSYAMVIAILSVIGFVMYNFMGDPDIIAYAVIIPSVVILLIPIIFRYSRLIFIHVFGGIKYQPELGE